MVLRTGEQLATILRRNIPQVKVGEAVIRYECWVMTDLSLLTTA